MNSALKNFFVGTFVLSAISLLVLTVMFLKPHVGDGKQILLVRFSDINKLNVGTRVLFAGRPVGEVVKIEEIHDARAEPTDELGRVYFYELTLKVDSHVQVFNTDKIATQTSGLLGERGIAIVPKSPPKGIAPRRIASGQPIYADSVDPLENALIEFSELSGSMEQSFNKITSWISDHGPELANSIQSVGAVAEEFKLAVSSINEEQIVGNIKQILTQVQTAFTHLEQTEAFSNTGLVVQNIKNLSENLLEGKGTVGRLLNDNDLYLSTNALLTKVNTLINDINNYGLLFHLNRRWQRLRPQKVSLQNALNDPRSFATYCQTEMDQMNGSLGRLSLLLEETNTNSDFEENESFKREFATLLRQANELSDNLRLYNQQLLDLKGN